MKIIMANEDNIDKKVIGEAIKVMGKGGVVLYPTDTVYGLGANIFDKRSVKRIFEIKNRNRLKPLSVLVSDKKNIPLIANVNLREKTYINNYLPGPYTLILNKKPVVSRTVTGGQSTVGVRVPDSNIAPKLASIFPIITTSANLADNPTLTNPDEIIEQLGNNIDLVIDVGTLEDNTPSTIIDLTNDEPIFFER